jgi:histidinol-phosphate aminotransferase
LDYAELEQLGLDPAEILDFSVNSNPYGPSPLVQRAIAQVPLERYPDREALALRRALAAKLAVEPEQIVVGNGAAEVLWLIALVFLQPTSAKTAFVIGPTFGEYTRLATMMGAQVKVWQASPDDHFVVDFEEIASHLNRLQPRLVFLCNPNNPTGSLLPLDIIATWAWAYPETLFVVDEAYLAFAPAAQSVLTIEADNILVVRSMTKDYALAGLRLGYVVGRRVELIAALRRARPAWNGNALAQAAGVAALADKAHQEQSLHKLLGAKPALIAGLQHLGLSPLPSTTHFFVVDVKNGAEFRQYLLKQGILVRDCASFGLPAYVRIATRRASENSRLLETIQAVLTKMPHFDKPALKVMA